MEFRNALRQTIFLINFSSFETKVPKKRTSLLTRKSTTSKNSTLSKLNSVLRWKVFVFCFSPYNRHGNFDEKGWYCIASLRLYSENIHLTVG